MQTGFQMARDEGYDVAVQVDGDGQHPPGNKFSCSRFAVWLRPVPSVRFLAKDGFHQP